MERASRRRSSSAGNEKMERDSDRQKQMEGRCSTGQGSQRAVVPMEEDEEEEVCSSAAKRRRRGQSSGAASGALATAGHTVILWLEQMYRNAKTLPHSRRNVKLCLKHSLSYVT